MTLLELLQLMKRHLKLVIILPVACAVVAAVVCWGMMPNEYTAKTSMYVLAKQEANNTSMQSTLSASQMITSDVAALMKSDRVTSDVASDLGMKSLKSYDISVSSETTTRVITLSVTGKDAQVAANIANAMADDVSDVAQEVMDVSSVNVIDEAKVPTAPSGPKRPMYVAVAFLAGLFVAIAVVVLQSMINTKVSSAEEVEQLVGLPVIGQFPAVKKG